MIRRCVEAGLPEPEFAVTDGFVARVRRPQSHACVVTVYSDREPLTDIDLLALFPNGTWKRSATDERGEAGIELHSLDRPMTVFAAAPGFAACLEQGWRPAERALSFQLSPLADGGSVIFPEATGYLPGFRGRLNPIRDAHGRTYLYASNIAINGGQQQPVEFALGEELRLMDSDGKELLVRIADIVSRSALIEYWAIQDSPRGQPESRPESLEARVLALLAAGPMSKAELSMRLGQKKISGQLNKVVRLLRAARKIAYTLPDKPQSRHQKYRLVPARQADGASPRVGSAGA